MNNFALVLTGPAGSGKSTIGEKIAKHFPNCVNIDADHIKHMIVDGFYVDENNPEDPDGWGFSKWELVGESIGLLVNNFLKHGHDVVVNGYIDEPAWVELQKCSVLDYKVLLLPTVDKVIERDAGRNQDVQMGEPTVRKHYAFFSQDAFFDDFIKIDSSQQTVDQTVADIIEIIGRSR